MMWFGIKLCVCVCVCLCVCVCAGKEANPEERHAVLQSSEQFIIQMNYPTHTQVNSWSSPVPPGEHMASAQTDLPVLPVLTCVRSPSGPGPS